MHKVDNFSISGALQVRSVQNMYILALFVAVFFVHTAQAQSYRYMDAAGNLIFVDRADQVPPQYRNQVPALVTPTIRLNRKQAQQLEREKSRKKAELDKKKQQEERRKQQELEKAKREHEKRMRKHKGKKTKNPEDMPDSEEGDFSQVPEQANPETLPEE